MNLHQRRVYSQNIEGVLATTANQFKSKHFLKNIVGTYLILVCFLSAYVFKLDFFFLNENGNIFLFSISTNMCIFALVDFLFFFFFKNEKQNRVFFLLSNMLYMLLNLYLKVESTSCSAVTHHWCLQTICYSTYTC